MGVEPWQRRAGPCTWPSNLKTIYVSCGEFPAGETDCFISLTGFVGASDEMQLPKGSSRKALRMGRQTGVHVRREDMQEDLEKMEHDNKARAAAVTRREMSLTMVSVGK